MTDSTSGSLFGDLEPPPPTVEPAQTDRAHTALAANLPPDVRLGTSSWSFPGWRNIVWADQPYDAKLLADAGLTPYAAHPILNAVGIDRTFYAPLREADYKRYAQAVPDHFRFLVKAPQAVTQPWDQKTKAPNPDFLNHRLLISNWIEPMALGLGDKLGVLVVQFTPLGRVIEPDASAFIARLAAFLNELPGGVPVAVEVRDRSVVGERYRDVLRTAGVDHCYNVHPKAATLGEQSALFPAAEAERVVVRWMLGSGLEYESAREMYAPFDRLVSPDVSSRDVIAGLASVGRPSIIIVNNKAEGSAPLSCFRLAGRIAELCGPRRTG